MTVGQLIELLDIRLDMGAEMAPWNSQRHDELMALYREYKRKVKNDVRP